MFCMFYKFNFFFLNFILCQQCFNIGQVYHKAQSMIFVLWCVASFSNHIFHFLFFFLFLVLFHHYFAIIESEAKKKKKEMTRNIISQYSHNIRKVSDATFIHINQYQHYGFALKSFSYRFIFMYSDAICRTADCSFQFFFFFAFGKAIFIFNPHMCNSHNTMKKIK